MSIYSTQNRTRRLNRGQANEVVCPVCGAKGDEPCVTKSGKVKKNWHKARNAK